MLSIFKIKQTTNDPYQLIDLRQQLEIPAVKRYRHCLKQDLGQK